MRKQTRIYLTQNTAAILEEFHGLGRLDELHLLPKKGAKMTSLDDDVFADFLQKIYESNSLEDFPQ